MATFFDRFIAHLETTYPESARAFNPKAKLHPPLICPDVVSLPSSLTTQAKEIVRAFSEVRALDTRSRALESLSPPILDPGNFSVLMSYDFHVDSSGHLRLIEINTNASLSLLVDVLAEVQGVKNPFSASGFKADIANAFREEYKLSGLPNREKLRVAIVDDQPESQRLYMEFLMYQELMNGAGFDSIIADSKSLHFAAGELRTSGLKIDLVYNRDTDFYFESPALHALREAMTAKAACITPHPHEYRLLADKERLRELSKSQAIEDLPVSERAKEVLARTLIRSFDLTDFASADELWAERKKLFFKPKRSFGGKAAYRGSSITRTAFNDVVKGNYVAQDYVPAPSVKLKSLPDNDGFKYDLRFYVYRDEIQLACARVYKGQMTNSQSPGGGAAVIEWT